MSWFNFKFFEVKSLKGDLEKAQITAACFGRTYLIVCVSGGMIYAYDRSSKAPVITFRGYNGTITHVKHLQTKNVVVTVGDENGMPGIIRIWDMDKIGEDQRPQSREHRMFKAQYPAPPERIPMRLNYNSDMAKVLMFVKENSNEKVCLADFMTHIVSFDVSEDLQHIVAGLANGEIFLMKGDLERSPSVKKKRYKSIKAPRLALSFVGFLRQKPIVSGDVGGHADPNITSGSAGVSGGESGANEAYGRGTLNNLQQFATSRFGASGGNTFSHLIYAVYDDRVTLLRASAKGFDYHEFDCAPFGCNRECCCLSDRGLLAVAHNKSNRVFFFGGENRDNVDLQHHWDENSVAVLSHHETPIEIEGVKKKLCFHKNYLVVLSLAESRNDKFLLQAFDYEHNLRALSEAQSSVAWVLPDVGQLLVISQARQESKGSTQECLVQQKVYKFVEIELKMRLKQLFERECYDKAVSMAKKVDGGNTHQEQTTIQLRYGDHLFKKGKYDEAIQQYKETIGSVEPSYVIRQFLDAQRIKYLTEYLKELHRKKHRIANKSHTTLLLNCYTKMDDRANLKKFIEENTSFDAHNAIKVCRQAGYYEEALTLAKNYHEFNDYVKIQLENLNDADAAIQFITDSNNSTGMRSLGVDNAESILKDHGKELLSRSPKRTTDLLKELCTHWKGGVRRATGAGDRHRTRGEGVVIEKRPTRSNAYEFIHTFVDSPRWMLEFLEYVANSVEIGEDFSRDSSLELQGKQKSVYNTLIELYLTKDIKDSIKPVDANSGERSEKAAAAHGETSTPHPKVAKYDDRIQLAFRLMDKYSDRFDMYHVLALVQQHKFEKGILFMLKKLGLSHEIFVHHAKTFENESASDNQRIDAKNALMSMCAREEGNSSTSVGSSGAATAASPARGSLRAKVPNSSFASASQTTTTASESERELWISLLSLLVRVHCPKLDVAADITDVLKHIQDKELLPPVVVIEIMSSNSNLKLKAVRDYVVKTLKKDRESIVASQKVLSENTDKATKLNNEVRLLETSATLFQTSKCTGCQQQLDLPAVHFLCKHSYHKRCLNETNLVCNICAPETRRLVQMQKELETSVDAHDNFFNSIAGNADGFSAIANHFSKGIFAAPKLKKEALLVGVNGSAFTPGVGDLDLDNPDAVPDPMAEGW